MKKPVIIDVDTGIDDAMAIMMLSHSKHLDIKFFCSVSGNTSAKQGAKNTLSVLAALQKKYDVLVGANTGFKRTRINRHAHGNNGLGNVAMPKHSFTLCKDNYIDRYKLELEKNKKKTTILALGPLTNIAKLLKKHPNLSTKIEKVVFMGSSLDIPEGETPYAGFNVACDPEALEFVMQKGVKILFCPNNLGRSAYLTPNEILKIANTSSFGKLISKMFENYKDHFIKDGAPMYDPCAAFALLQPKHCTIKKVFMDIRYYPCLDTALAIPNFNNAPNAEIVTDINTNKIKKMFFKKLKNK